MYGIRREKEKQRVMALLHPQDMEVLCSYWRCIEKEGARVFSYPFIPSRRIHPVTIGITLLHNTHYSTRLESCRRHPHPDPLHAHPLRHRHYHYPLHHHDRPLWECNKEADGEKRINIRVYDSVQSCGRKGIPVYERGMRWFRDNASSSCSFCRMMLLLLYCFLLSLFWVLFVICIQGASWKKVNMGYTDGKRYGLVLSSSPVCRSAFI